MSSTSPRATEPPISDVSRRRSVVDRLRRAIIDGELAAGSGGGGHHRRAVPGVASAGPRGVAAAGERGLRHVGAVPGSDRLVDVDPGHRRAAGQQTGRTGGDQITLYNSAGGAIQDLAIATLPIDRARELGRGRRLGD